MPIYGKRKLSNYYRKRKRIPVVRVLRRTNRNKIAGLGNPALLKDRQRIKFIYASWISFVPTAGTLGLQVNSCNGLFDPDVSGSGHQPRGFDQIMALYNHYVVNYATIELFILNQTANPGFITVLVDGSPVAKTSSDDLLEAQYQRTVGVSNEKPQRLLLKCAVSKYLGYKTNAIDDVIKGTAAANPGEQVYFHTYCYDKAGNAMDMKVQYRITYHAMLLEPKQPASS